jgi:mycothiol synthase
MGADAESGMRGDNAFSRNLEAGVTSDEPVVSQGPRARSGRSAPLARARAVRLVNREHAAGTDNPLPAPAVLPTMPPMSGDGEFRWRPVEPGDAQDWAVLLAAIQAADGGWDYFSEQELREDFGDPYRDFARGSVAICDGSTMAGYGVLASRAAADPVHDMQYQGGVHPAYRNRGLGGQLLDWAEKTALPLHRERYPGRPLSLLGSCLAHDAGAVALYAAHGYRPARWFHAMVRDLPAALPRVPVPAGVEIAAFTPERMEDARLVRNEAFHDHWGTIEATAEQWTHFIGLSVFRPAFSFLAYADGEPLGLIVGHEYELDTQASGARELYIALVGTRRAGRNRGIASALLARALSEAKATGFTTATLEVDADSPTGALGLYERAGFTVEHTSITQTKPLLEGDPAAPVSSVPPQPT